MKQPRKIILRPSMPAKNIYEAVQQRLVKSDFSLRDLCAAAKMSRMTLWQWREGLHEPRLDSLVKLCKGLNKIGIRAEIKF